MESPKNLTRNILLGMFLGALVGAFFFYAPFTFVTTSKVFLEEMVFNLGSEIFMNLLKMLVVPLVFFSLVSGIASLTSLKSFGSIAGKTVGLYLFTTAIAVSLSLFSIFKPGSNYLNSMPQNVDQLPQGQSLYETIAGIFPANILEAMASNDMLAIVFFSILFGLALNKTNHLTGNLSASFEKLNTVFLQLVLMVMTIAPVGVFCLIGKFVITDGFNIFKDVVLYVVLLTGVLLIHAFVTYSLLLKFLAQLNPLWFFNKMKEAAIFAFSTSSSAATIPVTLKTVNQDIGVDKDVASFVVPVGATINMDGTAIMQGMATIFIAQIAGMDLTLIQYVQVVLLAVITSIGTAAVPSAGTITLVIILQQFNLPLEAIGIILAVDRILDMIRTSVNITGDATVACVVARSENSFNKEVFNKA